MRPEQQRVLERDVLAEAARQHLQLDAVDEERAMALIEMRTKSLGVRSNASASCSWF